MTENPTIIRHIRTSDISTMNDLFRGSGPYVSARGLSDYWLYAKLFANTCFVATDGNNLVGTSISFLDQSAAGKEMYLQDIAVLPSHRATGIGASLLSNTIKQAQALSVHRLWLTSEPENEAAIHLWHKFGFKNKEADYLDKDYWVTKDLKGPNRDRAVFELDIT